MTQHPVPSALSVLALAALSCGLVAGCGGGNAGSNTTAGVGTSTATAAAITEAAPRTTAGATTMPRSRASQAKAALAGQTYTPPKRRFGAAPIDQKAASRLAHRGAIIVPVAVGGPGKISAFGQAQIPGRGVVRIADAVPRVVRRASIVHLRLRLNQLARTRLAAGRHILMYVAVRFSKGQVIQRIPVHLNP